MALLGLALLGLAATVAADPAPETEATAPPLVSVDFKEAPLVDALRYLAMVGQVSLVLDPAVRGEVTTRLIKVDWKAAVHVMTRSHGLAYQLDDGILYVAPAEVLNQRLTDEAQTTGRAVIAESLQTVLFRPNAGSTVGELTASLRPLLSQRGWIGLNGSGDKVVVVDHEDRIAAMRALLARARAPRAK